MNPKSIARAFAPAPPISEADACPQTEQLLRMADRLGSEDLAILSRIITRTGEICESHGEETALAVLDQIDAILKNRLPDA